MARAKQLPSGMWRVLLFIGVDKDGKRRYKSFTAETRREAEYLAAQYSLHPEIRKPNADLTLEDALEGYISAKDGVLSPSTIRNYRRIVVNFPESFKSLPLRALTSAILQAEVSREAKTLAPKTVRNNYGLITAALSMYLPGTSFTVALPQKEKPRVRIPTRDELRRIFAIMEGTPMELPVNLAVYAGMRRSEIAALDLEEDVDYEKGTVTVRRAVVLDSDLKWVMKPPKTSAGYRTISVPPFLLEKLRAARDSGYTFPNPTVISDSFFNRLHRRGITGIRFHDLRHYYASVMLALGVPDKYAMERMGHATPNMLKNVYQHLMPEKSTEIDEVISASLEKMQHEMQHEK